MLNSWEWRFIETRIRVVRKQEGLIQERKIQERLLQERLKPESLIV